jgi:hypothetical protein
MPRPFKFEKPIEVMIPTTDNWYPNYENNMVRLVYVGKLVDGTFRVAVWGADDFGVEYDAKDKGTAKELFNKLKTKTNITQKELYDLGFVNA